MGKEYESKNKGTYEEKGEGKIERRQQEGRNTGNGTRKDEKKRLVKSNSKSQTKRRV